MALESGEQVADLGNATQLGDRIVDAVNLEFEEPGQPGETAPAGSTSVHAAFAAVNMTDPSDTCRKVLAHILSSTLPGNLNGLESWTFP
jgi:hypothetical protein